jgi:hypothetical protein
VISESSLHAGKVVKVMDHGTIVQLLCADDRGLLSVYFEIKPFELFQNMVKKAGLSLKGLEIEFNSEIVNITRNGKTIRTCQTRRKPVSV